jgi:signal transduction histidine kinase
MNIRHGLFKTTNGIIYIASYTVPTNKILKRYFEACDYFIPTLQKSVELQKSKTKYNFRRFKHNLVTHHTKIHQELEFAFPIDNSERGVHNQIDFIKEILKKDPKESAISILKIIKSSNLMKSEFDVYNMINSENQKLEFYFHCPKKLVIMVISPFWLELIEKGIKIDIGDCKNKVYVDYKYLSVILSHIFENTSKYIANDSTLNIYFIENDESIEINFQMISLKIEESEKELIFNENFSGHFAKSLTLAGTGIGLNLVKKLVKMNNGEVSVEINTNVKNNDKRMGIPFEENIFKIKLPKKASHNNG